MGGIEFLIVRSIGNFMSNWVWDDDDKIVGLTHIALDKS
jgi:hypothetical protein